jgi:hypothetical protein
MAFPIVAGTAASQTTISGTTHTVSLPTGIVSGELLVVAMAYQTAPSFITFPAGWTAKTSSDTGGAAGVWAYRVANGTEGTSITVTFGIAQQAAHRSWRIQGHSTSTNPMTDVGFWQAGTSAAPDTGAATPVGGTKDYLWLWFTAGAGGRICTSAPTSYTNLETSDSGSAATSVALSTARRALNAASENAGAGVLESSGAWMSIVTAVHPGSEGSSGGAPATQFDEKTFSILIVPHVALAAPVFEHGVVGHSYSYTFAATDGVSPYTYASTGTLPLGLTLTSAGVLSGVPTAVGSYASWSVTVTDFTGVTATTAMSLVVDAPTFTVRMGRALTMRGSPSTIT